MTKYKYEIIVAPNGNRKKIKVRQCPASPSSKSKKLVYLIRPKKA